MAHCTWEPVVGLGNHESGRSLDHLYELHASLHGHRSSLDFVIVHLAHSIDGHNLATFSNAAEESRRSMVLALAALDREGGAAFHTAGLASRPGQLDKRDEC